MKSTDVRVGNLAYRNNRGVYNDMEIVALTPMDIVGMAQCEQAGKPIMFSPITLSEEILLRCGFEKENNDLGYRIINRFAMSTINGKQYIHFQGKLIRIEFLHQLQNWYFLIT